MKEDDDTIQCKKPNLTTDTDLHFELMADPGKLKPREKTLNMPKVVDDNSDSSTLLDTFDSKPRDYNNSEDSVSSKSSKKKSSSRSSKSSRSSSRVASLNILSQLQEQQQLLQPQQQPILQPQQQPIPQSIPQPIPQPIPSFFRSQPVTEEKKFPATYIPVYSEADDKTAKFKKMELLAKLYDIQKAGRQLTRTYNINSDIEDMEMEIRYQTDLENKKNSVNLCKSFLLNSVTALEFMNSRFDPFGIQLKGWSDQMKLNVDNYDNVFAELYEKHKGSGRKIEPELKLIFMLTASAASFHATKTLTKSAGLENVVKNNPELLTKLQGTLSGVLEKQIGVEKETNNPQNFQREMYKKMMEDKKKMMAQQQMIPPKMPPVMMSQPIMPSVMMNTPNIKKPSINELLNRVKAKIPQNVSSKFDASESSPRIKVTDTLDSDTTTEIDVNSMKKSRRKRQNIITSQI